MIRIGTALAAIVLAAILPSAPVRAAPACAIPATLETPTVEGAGERQPARIVPITGFTLALIWTPQHCRQAVPGADAFRCAGVGEGGFTLHGLWPDGANGRWPQWCAPAAPLPVATIRAHYCATPSGQLLQHEWAKHGTCLTGYTPRRYFARSNRLFARVTPPDMAALARQPDLTMAGFAAAFAAANPRLDSASIRPTATADGWLQEVWICLDTAFRPIACHVPAQGDTPLRIRPPAG